MALRESKRAVCLLPLLLASGVADYYVPYKEEQHMLWASFKAGFAPELEALSVVEDEAGFRNFLDNLKLADARNTMEAMGGGEPVHGVTPFMAMSQGDFERVLLQDALPEPAPHLAQSVDSPKYVPGEGPGAPPPSGNRHPGDGPITQDWSGTVTSPVRDQGRACAAGWAFAAAAQIESDAQRVLGVRYTLSPQQLLACDEMSAYCRGGWPEAGYAYVRRAGGLEREHSYPYASSSSASSSPRPSCRAVHDDFVLGLNAPAQALARESAYATEMAMAHHVNATGPLVVCVDATTWNTYTGGVLSACTGGGHVNHCLQVVGVHVEGHGGTGWWRLRNSWGSSWGEGGHVRLAFGHDTCGLAHRPTFTVPAYADARLRQAHD